MWRRLWQWIRSTCGEIDELEHRRRLLLEPWREQYLHLGMDGRMHGQFLPPAGRSRCSVTIRCPVRTFGCRRVHSSRGQRDKVGWSMNNVNGATSWLLLATAL